MKYRWAFYQLCLLNVINCASSLLSNSKKSFIRFAIHQRQNGRTDQPKYLIFSSNFGIFTTKQPNFAILHTDLCPGFGVVVNTDSHDCSNHFPYLSLSSIATNASLLSLVYIDIEKTRYKISTNIKRYN